MKKINDFLSKHEKLVNSLMFITYAIIFCHNELVFGASMGMLFGYHFDYLSRKIDSFIDYLVFKICKVFKK